MSTDNDRLQHISLPVKGNLSLIYTCSLLVAILMTVASIAGLGYRTTIYPTDELVRTFVANDVVNLFIGLPILLGSMYLAWRGKLIGLLCWTGALFFVFYNYMAYIFAMPLNWAFLSHLVLAVFSMYTLIGLVTNIDGRSVQQKLSGTVPEKFAGGVLTGLGLLFFLLLQPILTATPFSMSDVIVIFAMGSICFIPFALFVRGAGEA